MKQDCSSKKSSDGQLNLYRLMRLQNRQNSFIYRDEQAQTQLPVTYQHFPLQTISHSDLLKTFWKIITTHYFKKIDQEENQRLKYVKLLLGKERVSPQYVQQEFGKHKTFGYRFLNQLNQVVDYQYLNAAIYKNTINIQDSCWLKRMFVQWSDWHCKTIRKSKKINKNHKFNNQKQIKKLNYTKNKKQNMKMLKQEQTTLNDMINEMQFDVDPINYTCPQANIDDEIARLQQQLLNNQQENNQIIKNIQFRMKKQQQECQKHQESMINGEDTQCIEWLIHALQQKQIAESVSKIVSCQKQGDDAKFMITFQNSANIAPQYKSEHQLKKLNHQRETSLLKFYRTGIKSIYSFICQNFAGFNQLCQNRMSLSKGKDRDYLQTMKRGCYISPEAKKQFSQFDTCHQCKFIYPQHTMTTCKFTSDRQSMPKTTEGQSNFNHQLNLQKGRSSHRFVAKHRNSLTGYAKINDQFVCGRKFCKSCLKDNYGKEWMKNNNYICPFCAGVCSCTRCLRNQKMNKLKSFYISLGGNINQLQENSIIQKLPIKKDQIILKTKSKAKKNMNKCNSKRLMSFKNKTKPIMKQNVRTVNKNRFNIYDRKYDRLVDLDRKQLLLQEETQLRSATAEKQLNLLNSGRRASSRRIAARVY